MYWQNKNKRNQYWEIIGKRAKIAPLITNAGMYSPTLLGLFIEQYGCLNP